MLKIIITFTIDMHVYIYMLNIYHSLIRRDYHGIIFRDNVVIKWIKYIVHLT